VKTIVNTKNILEKLDAKINDVNMFFSENYGAQLDYDWILKDLKYYRNIIQNHIKDEIEVESDVINRLNFEFPKNYKYVKYEKSTVEELCDLFIAD
jgi:RNA processing factor Prp31